MFNMSNLNVTFSIQRINVCEIIIHLPVVLCMWMCYSHTDFSRHFTLDIRYKNTPQYWYLHLPPKSNIGRTLLTSTGKRQKAEMSAFTLEKPCRIVQPQNYRYVHEQETPATVSTSQHNYKIHQHLITLTRKVLHVFA